MEVGCKDITTVTSHMMSPDCHPLQSNKHKPLPMAEHRGLKAGASVVSSVLKSTVLCFTWKPKCLSDPNA